MLCLGIDPGFAFASTGAALLDFGGAQPVLIATYIFKPRCGGDWQRRCDDVLRQIRDTLLEDILPYRALHFGDVPMLLSYELAHLDKNPQTALRLADLGGGMRGLAVGLGLECVGVSPSASKLALASDAVAPKEAMIRAARVLFGRELSEHEADAVGHALAGEALWRRERVIRESVRE